MCKSYVHCTVNLAPWKGISLQPKREVCRGCQMLEVVGCVNFPGRRMARVKKTKQCKSTDMHPRSWLGKNCVPWTEIKKDAISPAWSGRTICCQDVRQPLNFYHVPTSTSQWGFGPLLLYLVVAQFFRSSVRTLLFRQISHQAFFEDSLMIHSSFHSQLSKALHQRKQILFLYILHKGKMKHTKMKWLSSVWELINGTHNITTSSYNFQSGNHSVP